MAIQEDEALSARVFSLLAGLPAAGPDRVVDAACELASIGFDSIACAEFAALARRELGVDLVDAAVPRLRTAGELADLVALTAEKDRTGREAYPRGMGRMQRVADRVVGPLCRWWFSMRVTGAEHVPEGGPVVLCMNHESFLDIPLVVVAAPRPIRFMAKRELFEKPMLARFFHELGGFSVDRDAFDLRAVEIALEVIRRGEVLGMYPEATRTPGTLLPFLPGAAWIALKTGTPLLPAALSGTGAAMPSGARFFKRVPITIAFGERIDVERVDDPVERRRRALKLTQRVRDSVERMWIR
jgi:1-acyl-sn-glycerol-3-phosphate acyltransferase